PRIRCSRERAESPETGSIPWPGTRNYAGTDPPCIGLSLDTTGFEIPWSILAGAGPRQYSLPEVPGKVWILESIGNAGFSAALAREAVPAPGSGLET
ncbi:MAG: hypothetical protein OXH76_24070, partial [Boseongicola sp.]|nr:hypothetical protein [Boseongicola sp.]